MKLTKWEIYKDVEEPARAITIKGGENRILSVSKWDNKVSFCEECDGYYRETFTKEEALQLVEELKEWINT
jgi:hypothetical protein